MSMHWMYAPVHVCTACVYNIRRPFVEWPEGGVLGAHTVYVVALYVCMYCRDSHAHPHPHPHLMFTLISSYKANIKRPLLFHHGVPWHTYQ